MFLCLDEVLDGQKEYALDIESGTVRGRIDVIGDPTGRVLQDSIKQFAIIQGDA